MAEVPDLDPVVSSTIPAAACCTVRAANWLQNLWLDTVNLLMYVLEKAEELELPAEVIGPTIHRFDCWAMQIYTTRQLTETLY